MKFVVHPEGSIKGKPAWSWRLETEAGVVLAKSVRTFEEPGKVERELMDVKSSAATTKVIRK